MAPPSVLPPLDVARRLKDVPGWRAMGKELVRALKFPTYLDELEFVYQLGKVAEDNDHHPDIIMNYKRVEVHYGTHDAGGITELDFKMALKIEQILKEFRAESVTDA